MTEFEWYKRFSGTAFDPKFKAAAVIAGSERCRALAVWDAALELSSESEDRGSVRSIDLRVIAAGLDVMLDEVTRIWEAFATLGMVSLGRITNWAKRQGRKAVVAASAVVDAADKLAQTRAQGRQRTAKWRKKKGPDPLQQEMFFVMQQPCSARHLRRGDAGDGGDASHIVTRPRCDVTERHRKRVR